MPPMNDLTSYRRLIAAWIITGVGFFSVFDAGNSAAGQVETTQKKDATKPEAAESPTPASDKSGSNLSSNPAPDAASPLVPLANISADELARIGKEYDERVTELRSAMREARELLVTYHLTTTRAEGREVLKKFAAAMDVSRKRHAALVEVAVRKYVVSPDAQLQQFLYEVLSKNCDDDCFEGMLEVGLALAKGGCKEPKLDYYIAFAAVANYQFDIARIHLARFAQSGFDFSKMLEDLNLLSGYIQNNPVLNERFAAEQKAIAADQTGDPLPRVRLITNKGEIVIELFENQAPETVGNFIKLIEEGFYNGLNFHRVLKHFMAQGGCPLGDGTGDAGYTIVGELNKPGARKFFRGTLGMALANGPDTGGSQFFICFLSQPRLDGKFVAFGRVLSGMDVLADLVRVDKSDTEKKESSAGAPPDEILVAEVISKRNHPYVANIAAKSQK